MKVLNISKLKVNDSHNYYGGAIGNIAYNQLSSLAQRKGIHVESTVEGTDLETEPPSSLDFEVVTDYDEITSHVEGALSSTDVVTHFYFHEPEYNPVSKRVSRSETPFVIGMCEVPHPRFKDEVSGIERLTLVRRLGRRLILPRFKRTLDRADRLIVVDEQAREYYSQYFPAENIHVVPYGVRLDRFQPTGFPDKPRILMVNRLIERRGIDYMIKALTDIQDEVTAVELHVVGDGPRRNRLESLARELNVRDAVTFHGNVSAEELRRQYQKAAVFSHLSYADGWNQPALEAMASGRPVVCTAKPHNSMVEDGETGYKVSWADSDAVSEAVLELLTDTSRAELFGASGRERVEDEYAWSRIANRYHQILQSVCNNE